MSFKNHLEKRCFEIAKEVLGPNVTIEHNKTVEIENAIFPEVASFHGPPKKEVDVLAAELLDDPRVTLLVSCKLLGRRAVPAHVQEWASVVQTMNKYADGAAYFGLVVSPAGFSSGSEAWATSHNLGILPPLKGRLLSFHEDTVFRMLKRVLFALRRRVHLQLDDVMDPPGFYDFVYRLVSDFEGHQDVTGSEESRYLVMPQGWKSSFGEMYSSIAGRIVEDLLVTDDAAYLVLEGGSSIKFNGMLAEFGVNAPPAPSPASTVSAMKNMELDPCTVEFVRRVAIGKQISSAGDFGTYLEVGLDQRFNLGLHRGAVHIMSTETPVADHRL